MPESRTDQPEDAASPRVCYCRHVDEATLLRAIRAGATDVQALQRATGAGTGCGTCRFDLIELLEREAARRREERR